MSFFSDLFSGNFGAAAGDIGHGVTSAIDATGNFFNENRNVIEDVGIGLGAAGLAVAAPFALPELGAAAGLFDAGVAGADIAAAGAGGAGDALAFAGDTGANAALSDLPTEITGGVSSFAETPAAVSPADYIGGASAAGEFGGGAGADAAAGGASLDSIAYGGQPMPLGSPPGGGASPAAAGGFMSTANSVLNNPLTRYGIPLASLGYNLMRKEPSLPPTGEKAVAGAGTLAAEGAAANTAGQGMLTAAANQQITPSQQAQIDTMVQNEKNQLYQQFASRGVDPNKDSGYIQGLQQIDQKALAMKQQFIQQLITEGMGLTGQASTDQQAANNALIQTANLEINQDKGFQDAISSSLSSLGLVAGLSALGDSRKAA